MWLKPSLKEWLISKGDKKIYSLTNKLNKPNLF